MRVGRCPPPIRVQISSRDMALGRGWGHRWGEEPNGSIVRKDAQGSISPLRVRIHGVGALGGFSDAVFGVFGCWVRSISPLRVRIDGV